MNNLQQIAQPAQIQAPVSKVPPAPAFQYYPKDLLTSQRVAVMTAEEFGAYWLLCSHAWLSDPQGTLPNDDRLLARLARLSDEAWLNHRLTIMAPFVLNGDVWKHPRLLAELRKQQEWREKSRQGGLHSGESRRRTKEGDLKGGSRVVEPNANSSSSSSSSSASKVNISCAEPPNDAAHAPALDKKSVPAKKVSTETPPDHRVKVLVELFHTDLLARLKEPVAGFPGGAAALGFKRLLKNFDENEIRRRIGFWFNSTDPWIEQNSWDVKIFLNKKFNLLQKGPIRALSETPKRPVVAGYAAPVPGKYAEVANGNH